MNPAIVNYLKNNLTIKDLECVIANLSAYIANFNELGQVSWPFERHEVKHGEKTYWFTPMTGICANCLNVDGVDLNILASGILDEWILHYGSPSKSYWVAGRVEFMKNNLCTNPRRLHAAIWLRHRLIDVRLAIVKTGA